MGSCIVHPADRLLEGVLAGRDGHYHGDLLVQPVEDMRHRFHWGVQLQRLSLHAGVGWFAALLPSLSFASCYFNIFSLFKLEIQDHFHERCDQPIYRE